MTKKERQIFKGIIRDAEYLVCYKKDLEWELQEGEDELDIDDLSDIKDNFNLRLEKLNYKIEDIKSLSSKDTKWDLTDEEEDKLIESEYD